MRVVKSKLSIIAALAIALTLALSAFMLAGCSKNEEPQNVPVEVTVEAPGWNPETSSAIVLHFVGDTEDGEHMDFYHAITSDVAADTNFEVFAGTYDVTVIAPVNADGSTYVVPETESVTLDGTKGLMKLTASLDLIAEPTAEQLAVVTDALSAIGDAGDDTVADVYAKASANAQVRLDAIAAAEAEAAAKAAAEAEAQAQAEAAASASATSGSKSSGNSGSSYSAPSGGGKTSQSAPAQSTPAPAPAPSQSAPAASSGSGGGHKHHVDADGWCDDCGKYVTVIKG